MENPNENNANINKKEDYIEMPSEEKLKKLQCLMDEVFDENREKILNKLVSRFYDKFYEGSKDKIEKQKLNINLDDLNYLINNEEYVKKYGIIFSAFISAMINKISANNTGKVIELNLKQPINYLLAKVRKVKVKGNIAGDYLAVGAEESQIYFKEAGNVAGGSMKNSTLILDAAGNGTGGGSNNKIFIKKIAGDNTGFGIENSYMIVNKAGDRLGAFSYGTNITANITEDEAGYGMKKGELNINISGRFLGMYARYSVIKVKKLNGDRIGIGAQNTNVYVYEMEDVSDNSINISFFKGPKNNIYLGKETYDKIIKIPEYQEYKDRIKIWDEQDYKEWNSKMEAKLKELESVDIF